MQAANHEHRAGAELRRLDSARWDEVEHRRPDQAGVVGRFRAARGDADLDHLDATAVRLPRQHPEPDLRCVEGDRQIRPHARAFDLARRRVDPRRNVNCDDRPAGGVDRLDRGVERSTRSAAEARAEQRIDDRPRSSERFPESRGVHAPRHTAGGEQPRVVLARVVAQLLRFPQQERLRFDSAFGQAAGRDEAIAAVVPLAAHDPYG
jgi:hypothetical protein